MINVCHIVNHITGKADGVYTHLKMIFSLADKNRFKHFLIFQGGEKVEKEISKMGVEILVCESLKKKISIKAFTDIYKFTKKNNIDIIHTHLIKPYAIGGLLNILLRRKLIFNYNGLFIYKNIYYNILEKSFYGLLHYLINLFKAVDVVLVPSKKSRGLILLETKLFTNPIVYYNGYDIKNNQPLDKEICNQINRIKRNDLIIAVVSRLEMQKRIDLALKLFKEVSNEKRNISLLIFGDGVLKKSLQDIVHNLEIDSKVFFFDYVLNISSYFYLFDILLFTSDWEGMPLTMWEAMAFKVPILAPDVGGFKEILEENKCGLVYKPDDPKEAEQKLLKLIKDSSLRRELGENGYSSIEKKYNGKNFINQIEKVYLKLIE